MTSTLPSIQFFAGLFEELSNVSLRRETRTGKLIVVMQFEQLKALSGFNSFTKQSLNSLLLTDEEGEIRVTPTGTKFIFGGDEGDELKRVDCKFEVEREDHFERIMRFLHRYADANGMEYGENN
ncbi:photosystem II reaction center protein Psb28 [Sphaerospermopsis torques-reginae]|uniref:Photosystem II reaction center Psb28 protein n=1 Tax=Sphaerospermopsis torques-reginae ITEP-024 TaxID=984208 RepID=A0ABX8WVK3_9CYAN|nr:photosystem II reaction center protein Psb28 [Sphaerospermopsis torques-reginae]QYX30464.1 photosystem II reaction center protein Psb28 [Sphaerospermopsis torques-reginae ITEP-024]